MALTTGVMILETPLLRRSEALPTSEATLLRSMERAIFMRTARAKRVEVCMVAVGSTEIKM